MDADVWLFTHKLCMRIRLGAGSRKSSRTHLRGGLGGGGVDDEKCTCLKLAEMSRICIYIYVKLEHPKHETSCSVDPIFFVLWGCTASCLLRTQRLRRYRKMTESDSETKTRAGEPVSAGSVHWCLTRTHRETHTWKQAKKKKKKGTTALVWLIFIQLWAPRIVSTQTIPFQ